VAVDRQEGEEGSSSTSSSAAGKRWNLKEGDPSGGFGIRAEARWGLEVRLLDGAKPVPAPSRLLVGEC